MRNFFFTVAIINIFKCMSQYSFFLHIIKMIRFARPLVYFRAHFAHWLQCIWNLGNGYFHVYKNVQSTYAVHLKVTAAAAAADWLPPDNFHLHRLCSWLALPKHWIHWSPHRACQQSIPWVFFTTMSQHHLHFVMEDLNQGNDYQSITFVFFFPRCLRKWLALPSFTDIPECGIGQDLL